MDVNQFGAVLLCGGQSSRMGRSKAWLPVGGTTMLQRVVGILSEVAHPIVVVAAVGQSLPSLPSNVIVAHDEIDGKGPLAGLAAGLAAMGKQTNTIYLSACDVPFLNATFVQRVVALLDETHVIAVPRIDGHFHPLAAVYRVSIRETAAQLLASDRLRMKDLFALVATREITHAELASVDPELQSLRNINTPEDYEACRTTLG